MHKFYIVFALLLYPFWASALMTLTVTSGTLTFEMQPGSTLPYYQNAQVSGGDYGLTWAGIVTENATYSSTPFTNTLKDVNGNAVSDFEVNTLHYTTGGSFAIGFGNALGTSGVTIGSGSITFPRPGNLSASIPSGLQPLIVGTFNNPGSQSSGLHIAIIPEPDTTGVVIGILLLAVLYRRRQKCPTVTSALRLKHFR